jgi:hypothetical protein
MNFEGPEKTSPSDSFSAHSARKEADVIVIDALWSEQDDTNIDYRFHAPLIKILLPMTFSCAHF